jgi:hypothetical protein
MASLPQVLEVIFQVQRKKINEKITRKTKAFQLTKHVFFLWEPLAIFKPHNFLIFDYFKRFKMLHECHLKLYKSCSNFNINKATYKEVFGCTRISFLMFNGLFY